MNCKVFAAACFLLLVPLVGYAHESRPGYLQINEIKRGQYDVFWKIPRRGDLMLAIAPVFPNCTDLTAPQRYPVASAVIERRSITCGEQGLIGKTITIAGLSSTLTDVLIRITHASGETLTALVKPEDPSYLVQDVQSRAQVANSYLLLGIEHILFGFDHLLFVLALLLLVTGWRRLVATVTAYTVAHSTTLALATLGFVHVPILPVEAVIALSILFVATEIVRAREGRAGLTQRARIQVWQALTLYYAPQ